MRQPNPDEEATLIAEAREALAAWGLSSEQWRLVGAEPGARGGLLRPVLETTAGVWILRRQAPDLSLDDTRFRHAYMVHLAQAGLPVPALLAEPGGRTWAIARDNVYELQSYLPGESFASDGSAARVAAAGALLGALHQTSADFSWAPYVWPEDRSAPALAQAYTGLIRQAAEGPWAGTSAGRGLARVADSCDERIAKAAHALTLTPAPPELHIHGDFQPHNLAFTGAQVAALYDFDAARWEQRVYELAYALLFFTGLRWSTDEPLTPPRVDDGLDIGFARSFVSAYAVEAPPSEEEAPLLTSALSLVFPIAFANGVAEDLVFPDDFAGAPNEEDALARLDWADRFWGWLDRYEDALAETWENS